MLVFFLVYLKGSSGVPDVQVPFLLFGHGYRVPGDLNSVGGGPFRVGTSTGWSEVGSDAPPYVESWTTISARVLRTQYSALSLSFRVRFLSFDHINFRPNSLQNSVYIGSPVTDVVLVSSSRGRITSVPSGPDALLVSQNTVSSLKFWIRRRIIVLLEPVNQTNP